MAATKATTGVIADDAIGVSQLSASGTASSSTFLRGDNSWATVGGTYELKQQGSYTGATEASINFTSLTHDFYILHIWNMHFSASEPLMIAISYDNGSTWTNDSGAASALQNWWYSTAHCTRNNGDIATEGRHGTSAGETELTGYSSTYKPAGGSPGCHLFGTITIDRKKDGEVSPGGKADFSYHNAGYAPVRCNSAWFHNSNGGAQGDMDAFKIYPNSGTISDIHYKLYGTDVT